MTDSNGIADKVRAGGARQRRRGARAVSPGADGAARRLADASARASTLRRSSPTSSTATSTTRTSASRKCNFCAFYRPVGSPEGYVLGFDELFRKIDETIAVGGVQLLLQGGHNPDLPLDVVRGSVPRGQGALSGVQAARAVAARGHPPVAAVAAAGARRASTG